MPFGRKPTDHFRETRPMARQPEPQQPQTETPREKFIRLGTSRMNRVLNTIKLLGNLASSAYDYTEQDIQDMKMSIVTELSNTLKKFDKHRRGEKVEFHFGAPASQADQQQEERQEEPPRTRQREPQTW